MTRLRALRQATTDDEGAVRKLVFIRRAREFGSTIDECRELIGLYQDDHRTSVDVKKIASKRLAEIEEKQGELQSLHDELAHLVKAVRVTTDQIARLWIVWVEVIDQRQLSPITRRFHGFCDISVLRACRNF